MTFRFSFLDNVPPQNAEDARIRFKIQALSDIYKAMQARLDGYRQSAGAVFLAVIAATLTFDASVIRFIDPTMLSALRSNTRFATVLIGGAALVVLVLCATGLVILHRVGQYFAEMTSVVYKIDDANQVFEQGAWIVDERLYPRMFQLGEEPAIHDVSRHAHDRPLMGWHDPAIGNFRKITGYILVSHVVFYGALLWAVCP
jgi:hypothetical protein